MHTGYYLKFACCPQSSMLPSGGVLQINISSYPSPGKRLYAFGGHFYIYAAKIMSVFHESEK
jgi:hypothetical protein